MGKLTGDRGEMKARGFVEGGPILGSFFFQTAKVSVWTLHSNIFGFDLQDAQTRKLVARVLCTSGYD